MANDVTAPSNPLIVVIEKEKLEETPLDMNVFQWSCKEELSKRVVHTQVDHSAWDYRLFPNPDALIIYLELFPTCGAAPKRFKKCQCEDDDVRLHCRTWIPSDGHYCWLRGPINLLSMEHQAKYLVDTIRRILNFLQIMIYPL
jgi:hypothetical protein